MQSQDNKDTPDQPSFEVYRDPKFCSRKNPKMANILKSTAHHTNMRKLRRAALYRYWSELKHVRVPRSDLPYRPPIKKFTIGYDPDCKKRRMATIAEEMVLFRAKGHSSHKEKDYKDKVASLQNVVKRLREMGVADSEKVKKNPEDVVIQFSDIQL